MRRVLPLQIPGLLLLAACGPADAPTDDTATAKLPRVEASAQAPVNALATAKPLPAEAPAKDAHESPKPAPPPTLGSSRYTSLEANSCKLVEENAEEGGYWRRRCEGSSGYALETTESDLRQDIAVIAPDGRKSKLNLSGLVANGRFDSLGKVAEWRGLAPGQPRALIVRVNVAAASEARRPDVSNLVVVSLDPSPCVVAVIPRGPRQNEKARAVAEGKLPACVKG
jgi:hypothetical protein